MESISARNIFELKQISEYFLDKVKPPRPVAFYGTMGVGKTTFIKELCKTLGAIDVANSPTFSIVNEYATKGKNIFHFDLYRIEKIEELLDIGFEEYLHQNKWVFIEWPQIAEALLPENTLKVKIEEQENGDRIICF